VISDSTVCDLSFFSSLLVWGPPVSPLFCFFVFLFGFCGWEAEVSAFGINPLLFSSFLTGRSPPPLLSPSPTFVWLGPSLVWCVTPLAVVAEGRFREPSCFGHFFSAFGFWRNFRFFWSESCRPLPVVFLILCFFASLFLAFF